ncbi:MAG: OmpA family protein [Balneolaceae bacterium]|nr:OmpA family protein [Balneolaceae bacterium]
MRLKSLTLLLAGLFIINTNVFAQTEQDKTWLSFNIGTQEYKGDFENEFFSFKFAKDFTFGLGVHHYLSESFDLSYNINLATLDNDDPTIFWATALNNNLTAKYKLANGTILAEDSKIRPFVAAGLGFSAFIDSSPNVDNNASFHIPLGLGFEVPITDDINFIYQSSFNRTFDDEIDGLTGGDKDHDDMFFHTIGLKMNLFKKKDMDGDGVTDNRDNCPTEMGPAETMGCPDADMDLIADNVDMCPNTAGLAEFNGCADSDSDGISDIEDECPNTAGLSQFDGCADSDADGIADPADDCPNTAGLARFNGCPDSDGDQIIDSMDDCPTVTGLEAFKGCPDTDGDGIEDKEDACPTEIGEAGNKGCPGVSEAVKEELAEIFENLQFGNNSAVIAESSMDDLETLYNIMMRDENLMLSIEGHTDSRGAADYNLALSQNRADAVKAFLVDKGINTDRITATGFGETQPIDTNETAEGRNNNRRVELNLDY